MSFYGSSTSNLIFATIGALSAMGATFKESLQSCFSQIAGVMFGVLAGVFLLSMHMPSLLASGIGVIVVITFYNIYPYDNSKQIRNTIQRLDKELILYLEDMFDGDENLPNINKMLNSLDEIDHGLKIFSDQKLLFHLKKQKKDLSSLLDCETKAIQLVNHLEILSALPFPGVLNPYNKERLERNGAKIKDQRIPTEPTEMDIITNYHVAQVLILRRELLNALSNN